MWETGTALSFVTIRGGKPGKTIALRADFDALPIQEETELPAPNMKASCMPVVMTDIQPICLSWLTV